MQNGYLREIRAQKELHSPDHGVQSLPVLVREYYTALLQLKSMPEVQLQFVLTAERAGERFEFESPNSLG